VYIKKYFSGDQFRNNDLLVQVSLMRERREEYRVIVRNSRGKEALGESVRISNIILKSIFRNLEWGHLGLSWLWLQEQRAPISGQGIL
jgi:hypothetical protein